MMKFKWFHIVVATSLLSLAACNGGGDSKTAGEKDPAKAEAKAEGKTEAKVAARPPVEPPKPLQQALKGDPRPSLLLAQAWFWKDETDKPNPGPARLDIWRPVVDGKWSYTRLEDGDSNVFHKALPWDGGILTIGAEGARLKKWKFADGKWTAETLWAPSWGGKFNRLRDIEVGDVDGDGKDELVIASHDAGVVAVVEFDGAEVKVTELDKEPDTFVHEIEIGDIDGDGKKEFFCTPSDRNKANASQSGGVAMYRWDGTTYKRTWVDNQEGTHAKEILVTDLNGDKVDELYGVMEAELDPNNKDKLLKPVEIRQYTLKPDGTFQAQAMATIEDKQTRFLIPGDFDHDGKKELIAAAYKTGIYLIEPGGSPWTVTKIAEKSSGFEHAAYGADLDNDGKLELYVAADDQQELRVYRYNAETKKFDSELLGKMNKDIITWNITTGTL